MIRRLTALAAVTAFAVAGVTLAASSRHAATPARITVTPASADATAPAAELDSIPAPVALEAPIAAPAAAPSSSSSTPASPAVVPVADNHQAAPLPASSVDAKPVTVARPTPPTTTAPPATAAPAVVEGPQPASSTVPVWMRDTDTGYCFQADPATVDRTAVDPSCADPANRPAPAADHDNHSNQQTRASETWLYDPTTDRCYRTGPAEAETAGHPRGGDTECASYANGTRDATTPVHDAGHPAG